MNRKRISPIAALVCALALFGAGCSASTTVTTDSSTDTASGTTATTETQDVAEPTAVPPAVEPTAEPTPAPPPTPQPEPTPAPDEPDEPDEPNDTDTPSPNGTDAIVTISSTGEEPRQELRMMFAPSCTESVTFDQTQEIVQTIDGNRLPETGPITTTIVMGTSARQIEDGLNEITTEVLSSMAGPDTPQAIAALVNEELQKTVGILTITTMTDRGIVVPDQSRVEGTEGLDPAVGESITSLNQAQPPLPKEAVGAGARWRVETVLDLQGAQVLTVLDFDLVSIEGTVVEIQGIGVQSVMPGTTMDMQGLSAEITDWDVTVETRLLLDMATISPLEMTNSSFGIQSFDFGSAGKLDQEITSSITSIGTPGDGCTGRSSG